MKLISSLRERAASRFFRLPTFVWFIAGICVGRYWDLTSGFSGWAFMLTTYDGNNTTTKAIRAVTTIEDDHDVFSRRVGNVIQHKEDIVAWDGEFEYLVGALSDLNSSLPRTPHFRFVVENSGKGLCNMHNEFTNHQKGLHFHPKHLVIDGLNPNWGALSAYVENRTTDWGVVEGWHRQRGCTKEDMLEHLDRQEIMGFITTQHQYNFNHPKAHSIPIGASKRYPAIFDFINKTKTGEHSMRKTCANRTKWLTINFSDFSYRPTVAKILSWAGNNTYNSNRSNKDVFEEMYCSRFVASPSGLGFDCYRQWEALLLGRVPILERHPGIGGLERTYDDLPILWVDRWEDVTQELLEQSWEELALKADTFNFDKLTRQYWLEFIRALIPEKFQ
mmetsp:Transcript_50312/g.75172  ORF Transcript_50312/g.75172 Transcript_50312/m.75172 type:complete len:390 (-) Transcript_50312:66-1235(-)|eukprot:CAMPEP_0194043724 /NCGR_PEP_ID=MMETSP0009_2-20130614/15306_1 /TAXON_ID=210454 /ORGANISM="Grammatophora oceanica, Strain CCMP 410" /LENGTH=389 /DNA_ID=CAMNT_0038688033 /DNA_START=116 /DNA_END=1285 /DNA_ORIENTATION=+